jgi:predicted RNA-binding Zn-ribbon protein involved in translation (DUF1610 family)
MEKRGALQIIGGGQPRLTTADNYTPILCPGCGANQYRRSQKATLTSEISTGTSTSGPMTVANATGDARPKVAMATAITSSKLLLAAVKAAEAVRG